MASLGPDYAIRAVTAAGRRWRKARWEDPVTGLRVVLTFPEPGDPDALERFKSRLAAAAAGKAAPAGRISGGGELR